MVISLPMSFIIKKVKVYITLHVLDIEYLHCILNFTKCYTQLIAIIVDGN